MNKKKNQKSNSAMIRDMLQVFANQERTNNLRYAAINDFLKDKYPNLLAEKNVYQLYQEKLEEFAKQQAAEIEQEEPKVEIPNYYPLPVSDL